jgi:hypothetical protein
MRQGLSSHAKPDQWRGESHKKKMLGNVRCEDIVIEYSQLRSRPAKLLAAQSRVRDP